MKGQISPSFNELVSILPPVSNNSSGEISTSTGSQDNKHSQLSTGALAGIGIGAVVILALVVCMFVWKRRGKTKQPGGFKDSLEEESTMWQGKPEMEEQVRYELEEYRGEIDGQLIYEMDVRRSEMEGSKVARAELEAVTPPVELPAPKESHHPPRRSCLWHELPA
ncbi:MAG: hypothetical protein M1820_008249 [Bogoriella megaspora]|nr:MAG: hypothetical protein M1820_008249 [Bogoriella megaspora]